MAEDWRAMVQRGWSERDAVPPGLDFRRLLDQLPLPAHTCDEHGLITYYNSAAVEAWGRRPRLNDPADRYCGSFRLLAMDGSQLAHPDCWMGRALATQTSQLGGEIVIERPDGTRFLALAHANPIFDETGRLRGAINVLVDISDRRRASETQALLAAIVASSNDAIVSKTLDGVILSWNASAQRLFGYSSDEVVGTSVTRLIPPERIHEEGMILDRIRRGERIEHYETVRVRKDGQQVDVSLTVSPVRDEDGRIVGASKIARDITARKQIEEAVANLQTELAHQLVDMERLHAMSMRLSTTRDIQPILDETLITAVQLAGAEMGWIALYSPDHETLEIEARYGFSSNGRAGEGWLRASDGPCGRCIATRQRVVVEDLEAEPHAARDRLAARQEGFRAIHCTPLVARTGEVFGVLATLFAAPRRPSPREERLVDLCVRQGVDFIENARLYLQLRATDAAKDQFLATLAHELRNPLAPLSNMLEVLELSDEFGARWNEMGGDLMQRQVKHLVRLVDDLLEVSRISRNKITLQRKVVDLAEIVAMAVETSRPLIDDAGQRLTVQLPAQPIILHADPVRLTQVISNLLNNAAKYTPRGGQIELSAHTRGAEAVLEVRDSGDGIPEEMLLAIFEMFAQVDQSLTRAQGGLGIGLTLARSFVELHGGRIEAASAGRGRGSVFTVRLPVIQDAAPATPVPAADESEAKLPTRRRILVVDDAKSAGYALGKLLSRLNQDVDCITDPTRVCERAQEWQPQLIISDIAMPGMNGFELAQQLRSAAACRHIILVALSGYGQESDRAAALAAGFDHYLVKPVSMEALLELLDALDAG